MLDVLIFAAIIAADGIFVLTWTKLVSPIVVDTIKQRLSVITKKYKVHSGTEKSADVTHSKFSLQYGEGVMCTQAAAIVHPETFEVPNNTSFVVADGSVSEQEARQVDLD